MPSSNQCVTCKHYTGSHECDAYPDGIPQDIMNGTHDHTKPFKGDGGIRWEEFDPNAPEDDVQ